MRRYMRYWRKLPIWETPDSFQPATSISVIIPARNEAKNIEACVQSVLNQKYPEDLFEVIVLDDFSTDETLSILRRFKHLNLKVIELAQLVNRDELTAFKKLAIETGIKKSSGKLIVTTDADCLVPDRWLQGIAHFYETHQYKFIAAPVNFHEEQNLLERFQSLDFTGMMGITGAGIHGRFMRMCNGANLAYTREVFEKVGGFQGINHLASGDDMLLMQKVAQQFPMDIGFLKNKNATVKTKAQPDWKSFFNQRLRWASKSSDYKEWQVTLSLGIVWLFCWAITFSLLGIVFLSLKGLFLFVMMLGVKLWMDYGLLSETTRFFDRKDLMHYFLPAQVLHILYIVSVGTISIFKKQYEWKGRRTR